MQSRRMSAVEATVSTVFGFLLSYSAGFIIYPLFGFDITPAQNLGVIGFFTVLSIFRGYVCRRFFNWLAGILKPLNSSN